MKMKGAATAAKPKMKNGVVQKPKKTKKIEKAEFAVTKYEEMNGQLLKLREDFEVQYPKAHAALQTIHTLEDEVREQIEACKILVRDAKQSVGPFTCTLKTTSEGYIGGKILELIGGLPDDQAGALFKELYSRGLLADVKVDKAAAKVIRASDAELREQLTSAWDKGGAELTPAVSAPKI